MDVKTIRKVVWLALGYGVISLGAILYHSVSTARASAAEHRIADQKWNSLSDALRIFHDTNGYYPASLDQLPLNQATPQNFRYWTNSNGGYTVRWEGKYGFRSMSFTSQSNPPSQLHRR